MAALRIILSMALFPIHTSANESCRNVGSVENAECGVWKMRSVENAGAENAECGKCGVWKMRGVENAEKILIFRFNCPFQCE